MNRQYGIDDEYIVKRQLTYPKSAIVSHRILTNQPQAQQQDLGHLSAATMSTNLSYDGESKKLDAEHVEYNENKDIGVISNDHHDTFEYPPHLRTMPEAPSESLLREALNGQAHQMSLGLGNAIKKEWRLIVFCLPYFISCMGQGFDSGAMNITGSMPGK